MFAMSTHLALLFVRLIYSMRKISPAYRLCAWYRPLSQIYLKPRKGAPLFTSKDTSCEGKRLTFDVKGVGSSVLH